MPTLQQGGLCPCSPNFYPTLTSNSNILPYRVPFAIIIPIPTTSPLSPNTPMKIFIQEPSPHLELRYTGFEYAVPESYRPHFYSISPHITSRYPLPRADDPPFPFQENSKVHYRIPTPMAQIPFLAIAFEALWFPVPGEIAILGRMQEL